MTGAETLSWIWSTQFFNDVAGRATNALRELDGINASQNLFIYIELVSSCAALNSGAIMSVLLMIN